MINQYDPLYLRGLYDGSGGSIRACARGLGVSEGKARKLLISAGIDVPPSDPLAVKAADMIKAGTPPRQAAASVGLSPKVLHYNVGYVRAPLRQWSADDLAALRAGVRPKGRSDAAARVMACRLRRGL